MGAWGEGAFDNDAAADWAHEFDGADRAAGIQLIEDALGQAAGTPADGYLGRRSGDLAVAAASLVAYIADQPVDETAYNAVALEWVERVDPAAEPPLLDLARRALARVTGEGSESADLWDKGPSTWRASVAELDAKLRAASSG